MCRVSIVIATYNGEKYIKEQLQSLLNQTMQPDEVIIHDDGSTDSTVAIIQEFIKKNELENWCVNINSVNKGWKKNFHDLLCQASGDIIFMCDQDDIWVKDKIESMYNAMVRNPKILCLIGRDSAIDAKGKKIEIEENESGEIKKIEYTSNFFRKTYRGCAMCISKEVLQIYKKMKCNYVGHDHVCAHIALMKEGMYEMEKVVIYHRYHGENATASKNGKNFGCSTLDARIRIMQEDIKYFTKLKEQLFVLEEQKKDIQNYVQCLKMRYDFLIKKNYAFYIKEAKYICNVIRPVQYIGDFAYALGLNKQFGKIGNLLVKK